jgi:hypothetical protein
MNQDGIQQQPVMSLKISAAFTQCQLFFYSPISNLFIPMTVFLLDKGTYIHKLPRLIDDKLAQTHFQRVETAYLERIRQADFDVLTPFTLLPELKFLKIWRRTSAGKETLNQSIFKWPVEERKKSPLKQLILHPSIITPEELEALLNHIDGLSSLVLEFAICNPCINYSSYEDPTKYEHGQKIVKGHWDRDTKWELCDWPPLLRVEDILQRILVHSANTKRPKHLAISCQPSCNVPWMDPKQ